MKFSAKTLHPSILSNGFSLIELLIVIAVVGVLAAGLMTVLNPVAYLQKSADAKRKTDLSEVQKALELYYQDNNRYPDYIQTDGRIRGLNNQPVEWGGSFSPYMQKLPADPDSGKRYVYYSETNGSSYWLYAALDRGTKDTATCKGQNGACQTRGGFTCGNTACNYGVSSSNVQVN